MRLPFLKQANDYAFYVTLSVLLGIVLFFFFAKFLLGILVGIIIGIPIGAFLIKANKTGCYEEEIDEKGNEIHTTEKTIQQ
ncbi:hypothetical protein [Bacillus thuringiensis]|uniref:hypothetical protein n=1 Tax=Bacillus thuringiensis TaxID=1428 RepID=UPI0021D66708|nr:hypothetical protein [Bacillus thuringiensis]MCU7667169.1 hypothetical protein [Bacillus thuringiensis]